MWERFIFLLVLIQYSLACLREPSVYHSRVAKVAGDNGFQIKINEDPEKYVPGTVYTMYLTGLRVFDKLQQFKRFTVTVESSDDPEVLSPQNVGSFQLFSDSLCKFNEDCINTISEIGDQPKTEVFFRWTAPPPGSGCVTFKAMILEDADHWYADDGRLSKTFCEMTDKDMAYDPEDCCACDEAKYSLIFEGIWSNKTHPKDFPFSLWLTHFSDVIGASHERNFSFWGEGQIASEGFRSLAEWGSVRMMETELRAKSKYLRTIIKAAGLWYPNVNSNTSANFKVDRRHHLISLASMFGPTPDWVVGVNGLNLCLKNCSWIENMIVDLYPYDAGTDSGVTYMSPNAETVPRERIYRITTTYPEDPRAPFYDPTTTEMPALAKLYIKREKIIPKNCDDDFLNAQVDVSENTEDTARAECDVTEYTNWSDCSVTCGKGLRMRTREYLRPDKALMFQCNRQLVSKEMCVAAVPECENQEPEEPSEEIGEPLNNLGEMSVCSTTPWGSWSECSTTCGIGFKMRTRFFVDNMGLKKCPHISIVEKEKCMGPECTGPPEVVDPTCPTTEWSDWSPCSTSCGRGVRFRTRLLLVDPALQISCSSRVELMQQSNCMDTPECTFDVATAKVVCMQPSAPGPCTGYFQRWYFNSNTSTCEPFIYGGCRGNRNNFIEARDCLDSCKVVKDELRSFTEETADIQPLTTTHLPLISVDCQVSPWTAWTPCNVTCGDGVMRKYRNILQQPQNGGRPCPVRMIRERNCRRPACPYNTYYRV